jgi:hypothetical protein
MGPHTRQVLFPDTEDMLESLIGDDRERYLREKGVLGVHGASGGAAPPRANNAPDNKAGADIRKTLFSCARRRASFDAEGCARLSAARPDSNRSYRLDRRRRSSDFGISADSRSAAQLAMLARRAAPTPYVLAPPPLRSAAGSSVSPQHSRSGSPTMARGTSGAVVSVVEACTHADDRSGGAHPGVVRGGSDARNEHACVEDGAAECEHHLHDVRSSSVGGGASSDSSSLAAVAPVLVAAGAELSSSSSFKKTTFSFHDTGQKGTA